MHHEYPIRSIVHVVKKANPNHEPSVVGDVPLAHPCSCMAIAPCRLIMARWPVLILLDLLSSLIHIFRGAAFMTADVIDGVQHVIGLIPLIVICSCDEIHEICQ